MNKLNKINILLNPKNIVLVGGYEVEIIIDQLKKLKFKGNIWPVNPNRKKIRDINCFKNVNDLPGKPDTTFIAIPSESIMKIIEDLELKKNVGLICYSAGFRESGKEGRKLETTLKKNLKNQVLLGPNCYGLINYLSNVSLWPFQIPISTTKSGIAIITQSGMLSSDILMTSRSLPITHMVSVGNQLNLKVEDFINYFASLNEVKVIGIHVEGVKNINKFSKACFNALLKKKPICVFKTGSSKIGKKLTKSHTGSLSGDEKLYNSLFKKIGIIKINDIESFIETLKFLSVNKHTYHSKLIAFTCSGGGATMIADNAEKLNLNLPIFKNESKRKIKKLLPAIATLSNPLDYTTPLWGKEEKVKEVFKKSILEINATTSILLQDYPNKFAKDSRKFYFNDTKAFVEAVNELNINGIVCSTFSENLDEDVRVFCIENNVSPLQGIKNSLEAIKNANFFIKFLKETKDLKQIELIKSKKIKNTKILNEKLSKDYLNKIGIKTPKNIEINNKKIKKINLNYPLVLKILSNKIFHKTEVGGVLTDIKNLDELRSSFKQINNKFSSDGSRLFLIEEMAPKPIAEFFFSLSIDPNFGKILVIGSGGIYTDILDDSTTLILPIDEKELLKSIESLRISKIIFGYRNTKKIDKKFFLKSMLKIINNFQYSDELISVEINPFFIYENELLAIDAIITLKK